MSAPTGGSWQSLWYPRPQAEQILEALEDRHTEQDSSSRDMGESGDDSGSMKSAGTSESSGPLVLSEPPWTRS